MNYHRTVIVSIAHFNGEDTYAEYKAAVDKAGKAATKKDFDKMREAYNHLFRVCKELHGHEFKIKVTGYSATLDPNAFVVDDEKLTRLIMSWDRCNLTLHHDFHQHLNAGKRISTELMVVVLKEKLDTSFPNVSFKVEIWEGDNICVSA